LVVGLILIPDPELKNQPLHTGIKIWTYPDKVECPCDHHDAGGPFLPDHSPEVTDRRLHGALSHDVGFGLNQALNMKGIKTGVNVMISIKFSPKKSYLLLRQKNFTALVF
jgi:hypothetical protein